MSTDPQRKVSTAHLARRALLYVRQSSLRQVFENTESTKRQYALRERAVALGWPMEHIHVIDADLGQSGANSAARDGFAELVAEVAIGHVGIVLGLEVSRLARNNADWHRLLELCALSDTLILDEDGVYHPGDFNDRLLLGLKGTMSEAELHVLRARLQGGIRNKARRGELEVPLPIGLVYAANATVVLDPDRQIEQTVRLIFETFEETRSAMAVVKRFNQQGLQFPRRIRRGIGKGEVHWGPMVHSRVLQILHNPRYAGAFVYGRRTTVRTADGHVGAKKLPREQWPVLIRDAHVGYISWEQYEHNQGQLRRNVRSFAAQGRGSVPREGAALLQGRVLCGRCGNRMRVRYQRLGNTQAPYYQCTEESVRRAGKHCQSVRATPIDVAVAQLLVRAVAPTALEAALAVQDEIATRIDKAKQVRISRLERARYDAELARRRYFGVDPDNRLVADALEGQWNTCLRELDALELEHDQQQRADNALLDPTAREQIRALAKDFQQVWDDPRTQAVDRKRMTALLIDDVTLTVDQPITVQIRFRGGKTTELTVAKPLPIARIRKTKPEVITALDRLLDRCNDKQAAERLNKMGHRNWKGEAFTAKRVALVRKTYELKSRLERLRERGFVTASELGQQLGVSNTTIHTWGRAGLLRRELYGNRSRCLYAPIPSASVKRGNGGRNAKPPRLITVQTS